MVFVDLHKQDVEPILLYKMESFGPRQSDYTVQSYVEQDTAYPLGNVKKIYKIHAYCRLCSLREQTEGTKGTNGLKLLKYQGD